MGMHIQYVRRDIETASGVELDEIGKQLGLSPRCFKDYTDIWYRKYLLANFDHMLTASIGVVESSHSVSSREGTQHFAQVRIGGLPEDSAERKATPVFSGVLKYFPDALAEVSRLSKAGNDKHNPGEPLHWAKEKSSDHDDCIARHQLDVAKGHKFIPDYGSANIRTRAAVAWRALAALQIEIEAELDQPIPYTTTEKK